jgi:hypothetical protein
MTLSFGLWTAVTGVASAVVITVQLRYFARSRLRVKSILADDGTSVTVTIKNSSRVEKVIDKIRVVSPDGGDSVITDVRYEDFADGTFKAVELAGESSVDIVIKAPKGRQFDPKIKLFVFGAGQTKVSRPSIAVPSIPSGAASVLLSDDAGPSVRKITRPPLTYLQSFTLAFFAIVTTTGIVYLLLSGIALKSQQTAFDYSRLERTAVQVLLFGAAIGVTAMAVIEVIKRITPVRAAYHVSALSKRLGPDSFSLLREVITVRQRNVTFFDLPIEQLTGQIGAALDQIVANIEVVPITWNPELEQGTADQPAPLIKRRLELLNAVIGRQFFVVTQENQGKSSLFKGFTGQESRRDLETALRSALDAGLDNIQLSVGYGWKRLVRLSAALISAISAVAISVLNGASYRLALAAFLERYSKPWFSRKSYP